MMSGISYTVATCGTVQSIQLILFEKGKRDDSINGIDLKRCKFMLYEKCFMSQEFRMVKVQLGYGHWHNMLRLNIKVERRSLYYTTRVQFILSLITFSALAVNFV